MSATTNQTRTPGQGHNARVGKLLDQRAQLGRQWAEQMSHGSSRAGTLLVELAVAETAITNRWPHMVTTWLPQWAGADTKLLHDPDQGRTLGCSICKTEADLQAA